MDAPPQPMLRPFRNSKQIVCDSFCWPLLPKDCIRTVRGAADCYKLEAMRYVILLALCTPLLLPSQTVDPNRTGYPHDMVWFNEPKNPQPGVTHHGYHSAAMDKEIG